MHKRATELQKKHPGWSYRTAQKEAGKEFRTGSPKKKSVSGTKKKSVKKSHPKPRHSTGGRLGSLPDTPTQSQLKAKLVKSLEEQAAWALLAKEGATNARDRTAQGKKAREVLRKLKAARSV